MRTTLPRSGVARGRIAGMASASLAVLVAAMGCTGSAPARYRALNEDWQRSEAKTFVADVRELPFEGASWLERRALVEQVLERNPTVRASRHAWRAALARYPQARALDDPMLGVGVAPLSLGSNDVDAAPKIELSQKLPFLGKRRLRGEAALAEAEAAAHDFEAVRLRLATMASLLFDEYALAARSLEINDEHVSLLSEFKQIATVRYEAGRGSAQDPIQAEVELAHAIHRDILLKTAQRVTASQINALLHLSPSTALPPAPARDVRPSELPEAPEILIEQALAVRPERAAAVARVEAEQSRLDLAWRELMPDFTLTGAYNALWQETDLQPFVGIALNVPLQLGRRRAAIEEAEARLEGARSQQQAIETDVRLAVDVSIDRLGEARHVEHLFRDRLLPAARDQVAAARSGFESGRNSFLALIDAQRNLLDVELGYEEALADLGRRRAELDRSLGRVPGLGW